MATVTQDYDMPRGTKRMRSSSAPGSASRAVGRYKYRGTSKRYRKKVPPGVRAYVKSAITRSLELKKTHTINSDVQFNPQIVAGDVLNLLPGMSQGTTQATRVGNSITLKRLVIRGVVNMVALGTYNSPTYVDVYIFKNRKTNNSPASMSDFLQLGSSSVSYDGDTQPYSGLLRVNDDAFKECIHERFYLLNSPPSAAQAFNAAINPSATFEWDLTRFMKKKLLFDDSITAAQNDSLWMACGTTQSDGNTVSGSNMAEITYVVEMDYTD